MGPFILTLQLVRYTNGLCRSFGSVYLLCQNVEYGCEYECESAAVVLSDLVGDVSTPSWTQCHCAQCTSSQSGSQSCRFSSASFDLDEFRLKPIVNLGVLLKVGLLSGAMLHEILQAVVGIVVSCVGCCRWSGPVPVPPVSPQSGQQPLQAEAV